MELSLYNVGYGYNIVIHVWIDCAHSEDYIQSPTELPYFNNPDMEKVKSFPPADAHFQISAKVKFQI